MHTIREDLHANTVLGVAAHADDLDFTAAGTIARLSDEGADVYYLILTDGCKGSSDPDMDGRRLTSIRQKEQRAAAHKLGVKDVTFLSYEDGALEVTQGLKRDIVRHIRRIRPDVVMAFDPTMMYYAPDGFINHPDHRACGQATLDAVYPLARDRLSFPELAEEGLDPHEVATVLLTNFEKLEYAVDVTAYMDRKIEALSSHVTQVKSLDNIRQWCEIRATAAGKQLGCRYAEAFVRIDVRP